MREVNNALQLQLETAAHLIHLSDTDFDQMGEGDRLVSFEDVATSVGFMKNLGKMVASFPTYWVSPDMCSLIEAAASQISDDDLRRLDWKHTFFADRGFVVFASPFTGCVVEEPNRPLVDMLNDPVQETFSPVKTFLWGVDSTETWGSVNLLPSAWDDADSFLTHPSFGAMPQDENEKYPKWMAYAVSFLLLAQQRVAVQTTRRPTRQLRRFVQKAHGHLGEATVVTLRRPHNRTDRSKGKFAERDHRWAVTGHWRKQWYASTQTHRLIWIEPYIKGPAGAPFRAKRRMFRFIR